MAGGEVGRLKVRVLPDTTRFRSDLRKSLERIERQARVNVEVTASVSRASLVDIRRELEAVSAEVETRVDAGELRGSVQRAAKAAKAQVPVTPDLDRAAFRVQLATLLRPRKLPIYAKLHTGPLNLVGALSGLRTMNRLGGEFMETIGNLDRTMPRLARNATLLGTVSAGALAGLSNTLAIAQSVAKIAPLLLVAPAALGGLVVGASVVATAMKDAGQYIGDLKVGLDGLRASISGSFWSTAESGVRRLSAAVMPLANQHLPRIAEEMGRLAQSIATAFEAPRGSGNLATFFENTRAMVAASREGVRLLTASMLELVGAGSRYLPRLGAAFTDVMGRFNGWLTAAVDSGRFYAWVDLAIVNFKALASVIGSIGGIFSALSTAASNAGGAGLPQLAAGLERVNAALNGPVWQGALTTIFEGAHRAMGNLTPGVSALGDAFIALAPTISRIMDLASQIANVALVALAKAVQNPAFTSGLTSFFEGVLVGMQGFAPAVEIIAEKLGSILALAGVFAANFGPLLAGGLEAVAPLIPALTEALSALIPVLTGTLLSVVQALAPIIIGVVTAIAGWVEANPRLAATLLIAAAAIAGVIAVVVPVVTALAGIASAWVALTGVVSASALGIGVAVVAIIAVLAGLVAAVAANWSAITAWWSEGMGSIQQQAKDGMAAIAAWWNDGWASMGQQVRDAWEGFMGAVSDGAGAIVAYVGEMPSRITGALGDLGGLLLGAGGAIMDGLLGGLRDKWGGVQDFVGGIAGWIQDHKGPISYDRTLLVPAGQAIMGGFNKALQRGVRPVRSTVLGIAPLIASAMQGVQAVARMTGAATGQQMALGLEDETRRVQAAMGRMMPSAETARLQVDSSVAVEEERRYHAEMLAGILGPAVSEALDGMAVNMDSRATVGALRTSRAGKGVFG